MRQRWGRVGVWWSRELASRPIADICATAAEVESFGFPTLWFGESVREAFSVASALLGATIRLGVATGVANVWVRDPVTSIAGARTLGEAHPGRFTLGLGISHARVVGARGHTYDRPLATMRAYLRDLSSADYLPPQPDPAVPVVIAALGPKMLELAAQHADGAHSYLVPIEHTASARAILGPEPAARGRTSGRPGERAHPRAGHRSPVHQALPATAQLREQPAGPRIRRPRLLRRRQRSTDRRRRGVG